MLHEFFHEACTASLLVAAVLLPGIGLWYFRQKRWEGPQSESLNAQHSTPFLDPWEYWHHIHCVKLTKPLMGLSKKKAVFQPSIFRCYLSFMGIHFEKSFSIFQTWIGCFCSLPSYFTQRVKGKFPEACIYIYIRTGLGWKNHFLGSNLGYTVFFYLQRCSCLGALTLEVFLDNAPLVFIDSLVRLYWCLCVSLVWKYVVTFVIHVMSMVVVDGLHGTLDILAIMSNRNPTDLCFF